MRPERDADYRQDEEPEEGEGGGEPRVAAEGEVAVLEEVGRRRREGHVVASSSGATTSRVSVAAVDASGSAAAA